MSHHVAEIAIDPKLACHHGRRTSGPSIWTDFDNTQYCLQEDQKLCCTETSSGHDCPGCAAIPDSMPVSSSPDFHYTWYIYEKDERPVPRTTHSPTAYITLPEWGCYYVELTVRDMKCGLESKYATQVAVIPEADVCSDSNRQCDAPASTTQMKSSFLFPSPNPGSMVGVVGLRDANVTDSGKFDGTRPIKFNFLVAPCYSDDPRPAASIVLLA